MRLSQLVGKYIFTNALVIIPKSYYRSFVIFSGTLNLGSSKSLIKDKIFSINYDELLEIFLFIPFLEIYLF